ncbi:hypothetical protein [uncultured Holdemanella sp.]|uniref:hypothetical protein n=1 Tax=uncultured Holdemanella sp. TaxID=1763549 RepID=UPI0025836230|nr:hypothetical protein [uncultured Holdemanella sp.]
MKEIGGYIELDTYTGQMVHDDGIKLNCGRNALAYIIKAKNIKKIHMPKFMCDSNDKVLSENGVEVVHYSIGLDFKPQIKDHDGWLYIVNFYGQLSNEYIRSLGKNIIVDNAQAYFQEPITDIDTLYTCRKFFGVPDGAILYTDKLIEVNERDESYKRMNFLLGRFERNADEFYQEYVDNNRVFKNEPLKTMSKLTENLLHGIDYQVIKKRRTQNFSYLDMKLASINKLKLNIPNGAFMYPLYLEKGFEIRKKLQKLKIFIPILWPAVFNICSEDELEYDMAKNILPIPVDQRYTIQDMEYIVNMIMYYSNLEREENKVYEKSINVRNC